MAARDPYFDSLPERQAFVWASAVRRQLGRWEPLVAKHVRMLLEPNMNPRPSPPTVLSEDEYWQGESEHFFLLGATRSLMRALNLMDDPPKVDATTRNELIETRDLLEHWNENIPAFNDAPRRPPGHRTGRAFVARNPQDDPYCWWRWNAQRGPLATPNVSGKQIHELVNEIVAKALAPQPDMAPFVPDAAPSPWFEPTKEGDWWWPRPA